MSDSTPGLFSDKEKKSVLTFKAQNREREDFEPNNYARGTTSLKFQLEKKNFCTHLTTSSS